jgi:hypothetical protein
MAETNTMFDARIARDAHIPGKTEIHNMRRKEMLGQFCALAEEEAANKLAIAAADQRIAAGKLMNARATELKKIVDKLSN